MKVPFEMFVSVMLTISVSCVGALFVKIDKVESSQYAMKEVFVTHSQLTMAVNDVNANLSEFIRNYEGLRREDRETFGHALGRIEKRQLENVTDIKRLSIKMAELAGKL